MNTTIINAAVAGVFVALVSPALNAVPELVKRTEGYFAPVVKNMRVEQTIKDAEGNVTLHIVGEKVRACKFLHQEGYAVMKDGKYVEVKVEFENDVSPSSTRPVGLNDFGTWKFYVAYLPNVEAVYSTVTHKCNWFWTTETKIGPYNLATGNLYGNTSAGS